MENEVIVKVENVSIKFCLASEKFDGFKEYFIQRVKKKLPIRISGHCRMCRLRSIKEKHWG